MKKTKKSMKVLVICAHPDDEVISMGGTLKKLSDSGACIKLLMFSDGAEGFSSTKEKSTIVQRRHQETKKVCSVLGISQYVNLHCLDWDLKINNDGYRAVIQHIRTFQPDMVFAHSNADYNDHKVVHHTALEAWFHAALPCAMDMGPEWKLCPFYEFEVLESISKPSIVMDITETFDSKIEAMKCYESQHQIVGGIFQMMQGRALERGSLIGVKYGEAFNRHNYRPEAIKNVEQLLNIDI